MRYLWKILNVYHGLFPFLPKKYTLYTKTLDLFIMDILTTEAFRFSKRTFLPLWKLETYSSQIVCYENYTNIKLIFTKTKTTIISAYYSHAYRQRPKIWQLSAEPNKYMRTFITLMLKIVTFVVLVPKHREYPIIQLIRKHCGRCLSLFTTWSYLA